jgi:AraC-like DNA-binding protein
MLYRLVMYTVPAIDTLSRTLMMMRLRSFFAGATDAAGRWALSIPGQQGLRLYLVLKGECWIILSGQKYHLHAGDCFLITSQEPLVAASDLSVKKRLLLEDVVKSVRDGVLMINGGGESFTVSVLFQIEGHLPKLIFGGLPPAIHIRADADEAASMRWNIERFRAEFMRKSIGSGLILNHLAPIILIQAIRAHMASASSPPGWLSSITDPKLSRAMEAMHEEYNRAWSIQELATLSSMSRARFAATFKKKLGVSPGEYLTSWRIQVACGLLRAGDKSIATIAGEVGYESESAFSSAFNKLVGSRPGIFRKEMRAD